MSEKTNHIRNKIISFYHLIENKFPVKGILLFGSYAKGNQSKDSDIDVAVIIKNKKGDDKIDITMALWHDARKIDTSIEPKCIFWDEYIHHDKTSILADIIRTGIRII